VVVADGKDLIYDDFKKWCNGKMSSYKIPKILKLIETLPRNAMGKVTKPDLKMLLNNK